MTGCFLLRGAATHLAANSAMKRFISLTILVSLLLAFPLVTGAHGVEIVCAPIPSSGLRVPAGFQT